MKRSSSVVNKSKDINLTAIKLVNNYADSYNILLSENRELEKVNSNLKTNIEINKSIINDLLSSSKLSFKETSLISNLRTENDNLNILIKKLVYENKDLRKSMNEILKSFDSEIINKFDLEIETLKNKIFILENAIVKKDNIIKNINKKNEDLMFIKDIEGFQFRDCYVSQFQFYRYWIQMNL